MEAQTYFAFIAASIVLCAVPGPDMIFIMSRSVVSGRKAGIYALLGINLGSYVHLIAAVFGLSVILATSAIAFTTVKWIGAAYLVYLGIQAIAAKTGAIHIDTGLPKQVSNRAIFWQGFITDVLNPKVALFYIAILPQFVNASAGHTTLQFIALGATLNVIGIMTNLFNVYFASALTRRLRDNARISWWLHKVVGMVFIGLGIHLASEKA